MLSSFLENAQIELNTAATTATTTTTAIPRSVVVPHAGYSYSGKAAAFSYLALKEAVQMGEIEAIVVLHPSHHVRLNGCAISGASELETPLLNLPVADKLRKELLAPGHFTLMEQQVDENEHSGEMQYPFMAKILLDTQQTNNIEILPVMVGAMDKTQEEFFGKLLALFLARTSIFTVVSSDFCHWGKRFGYYPPHDRDYRSYVGRPAADKEEIFRYIENLDRLGMNEIELQNPGAFVEYLKLSKNTICGRHPIAVWLYAIKENKETKTECLEIEFVKYYQSSQVKNIHDSSVPGRERN